VPPPGTVPWAAAVSPRPPGRRDLESTIGLKWLNWIGTLAILVGTAFFLRYDLSGTWIGGAGQLSVGFLVGLLFVVAGYRAHEGRDTVFSFGLTAGGIGLLYLSVYAAHAFYHLVPAIPALAFTLAVTAAGVALAIRYDSPSVAILSTLGGFLTPALLSGNPSSVTPLLTTALLLDLGVLALSWARSWRALDAVAFLATQIYLVGWVLIGEKPASVWGRFAWLVAFFLVFFLIPVFHRVARRVHAPIPTGLLVVANSAFHFGSVYGLLDAGRAGFRGPYALLLAVPHLAMAGWLLRRLPGERSFTLVFWDLAVAAVAIAVPIQLDLGWVTFSWALLGFLLVLTGLVAKSRNTRVLGIVLQGLALIRVLTVDTFADRHIFLPILNREFLTLWCAVLLVFGSAALYHRHRPSLPSGERRLFTILLLTATAALWWVGSNEVHDFFATRRAAALANPPSFPRAGGDSGAGSRLASQLTLSIFWGLYASALFLLGFAYRYRPIRVLAFVLIGVTVGKVFFVDLASLERAYRVVSFIMLGVLLLLLSFVYQRQRRRMEGAET
jgi:uncharacterized membrane protein